MNRRVLAWAAVVAAMGALVGVLMACVTGINAGEEDMVDVIGLFSLGAGTWVGPVVLAVATSVVAVVAIRRPHVGLVGAVVPVLATLLIVSIRRSVLDDAQHINDWIRIEGTASVDSPITRATRLHITDVDARPLGQMLLAAGLGALLTTAFLLARGWTARRSR